MAMNDRRQQVLRTIVALYATDGEPVGSNLLSRSMDISVSSATLRNEMAELTRLGFLEQPHTSAGRIPSAAGYRYYIDYLMNTDITLTLREKQIIDGIFSQLDYDPERLSQGAAKALSDLIGYTVVATTPRADDARIAHYELMQAGQYTAAILAVTSAGGVLTRVVKTDVPLTAEHKAVLTTLLNRALCFISAADISPAVLDGLRCALGDEAEELWPIINAAVTMLKQAGQPHTFLEGHQYLVNWSELRPNLPQIFTLFENSDEVQKIIIPRTDNVNIILGEDIPYHPIPGMAIMCKRYLAGSGRKGAIAIVGPERMPYRQLLPKLEYFALLLGQVMSGNRKEEF